MMVSEIMVRRLLSDSPGRALCDQCLAAACAATLTETREVTATLLGNDPVFERGASRCDSCQDSVSTILYRGKCAHCGHPFDDGDRGRLMADERLHISCLQQLITNDTIRLSQTMSRRSRRLIEESRQRIRRGHGRPPLEAS